MTIAVFVWYRFSCPRKFGYVLLTLYGVFMLVSIAIETSEELYGSNDAASSAAENVTSITAYANGTIFADTQPTQRTQPIGLNLSSSSGVPGVDLNFSLGNLSVDFLNLSKASEVVV